jgi:hypothetical protein
MHMATSPLLILTPHTLYLAVTKLPKSTRVILYEDRAHVVSALPALRLLVRTAMLAFRDRLLVKGFHVTVIFDADRRALQELLLGTKHVAAYDTGKANLALSELRELCGARLRLLSPLGITFTSVYQQLMLPLIAWDADTIPVFAHNDRYEDQAREELGLDIPLRFPVSHTDYLDEVHELPADAAVQRLRVGAYLGMLTPRDLLQELAEVARSAGHAPAWIRAQAKAILGTHEYRNHAKS